MQPHFSLKNILHFRDHAGGVEHAEASIKSRIWICPNCGKLYLTIFARSRQGHHCKCGHRFDNNDVG